MARKDDGHWWSDGKYVVSIARHVSGERIRWRVRGYAIGQHGEARWRYERTYEGAVALATSLKDAWLHGLADVERPLPPPRTIVDLGSAWLERDAYSERTGKPWSRSSVALRQGILENLYKVCGSARSPRTVTSQDVYRACDAQSSSRQYGSWCALRRMFSWALERGFVSKNPADTKQARRYYRPGPGLEPITEGQLGAMLQAAHGREAADVITILAFTGMRVGELAQWRHGWIAKTTHGYWIDIPEVQANDKGPAWEPKSQHGARCIPMVPEVWSAYLSICERWHVNPHNAPANWVVLPGSDARNRNLRSMTRPRAVISIYEMVRTWGRNAGIEQNVHPHTLRHLFGTMALDRGAPYTVISAVMGHSSVAVTEGIYARHTKRTLTASLLNHLGGIGGELRVPEPVPLFAPAVSLELESRGGAPVDSEALRRLGTPTGRRVSSDSIDPQDLPAWMDAPAGSSVPPRSGHKGAAAPSSSPAGQEHGAEHGTRVRARGTALEAAPERGVFTPVFQGASVEDIQQYIRRDSDDPAFTSKLSGRLNFIGEEPCYVGGLTPGELCAASAQNRQKPGTRPGTRAKRGRP